MKVEKIKLKDGISKQTIFEEAIERGVGKKKVSRFLSNYPAKPVKSVYRNLNFLLLALYWANAIFGSVIMLPHLAGQLGLSGAATFGAIALSLVSIVSFFILRMNAWIYLLLIIFMVKGIFEVVSSDFGSHYIDFIDLAYKTTVLSLSIYLKFKLFPFQNFIQTRKKETGEFYFS